jgi:hypothetical protein
MKVTKTLTVGGLKIAEKIYSGNLQCEVWVVENDEIFDFLRDGIVKYSRSELDKLRGVTPDELRSVHRVKEVFSLPTIVSQKRRQT